MTTLVCVMALGAASFTRPVAEATYFPERLWRISSPEAQGLDSNALADAFDNVRKERTRIHSLTIVRNGYVVVDATFFPFQNDQLHDVASVTKSVTATLIGVAVGEGKLRGVEQPVLRVFNDRQIANRDESKERLTLEHLLTMSSGLDCEYRGGERTLRDMRAAPDWIQFMLDRPMAAAPGTKSEYCSSGSHLLSGAITAATGTSALAYARRRLFGPLGIRRAVWPSDPNGVTHGWGDLHMRPLDMARIGYLWLNGGRWKDRQIVPEAWMASAVQPHARVLRGEYGYGLWVNRQNDPMLFEANGRGGQRITVLPSKQIVVAMTGGAFEPGDVGKFLLKALRSDHPLPENPVAARRLAAAIASAARPPASERPHAIPAIAGRISGKRFVFEPNPLGWRAVTFVFGAGDSARATLEFADGRVERRPIGLDGVLRVSPNGRFGLPVGLAGRWADPSTFVFEYDEIANVNAFVCRFRFEGNTATVEVKERSGEADLTIRATGAE